MTTPFRDFRQLSATLEADTDLLRSVETTAARNAKPESAIASPPNQIGSDLIKNLESFFARYVILPARARLPIALYSIMTHKFQLFDAVPYLAISSPAPRCGKTRLLECLELVVSNPRRASNVSEAALFRTIEKFSPTLLLDEAETLWAKSERAEYLRQIINAGNRRGAVVTRCIGQGANMDPQDFSVFGPKVLAGIGNFPPTITDRAIVISMQRRRPSEVVGRFLYRIVAPIGKALADDAAAFVALNHDEISAAYEAIELDFISDREAEAWAPLFAILAIAAPERLSELREAAMGLTHSKASNADDDSLATRLLTDMREVWPDSQPKIFTVELLARLKTLEDAPWSTDETFDGRRLSRYLRPFGIVSATVRIGTTTRKGFCREDAQAAFVRYLSSQPSQPSQPL
jgi:hypothetical protein